jgi:isopentenyl diphosphate isomerase/L-lactate dehydrogenase-like FMN-dependent dehydrogenase
MSDNEKKEYIELKREKEERKRKQRENYKNGGKEQSKKYRESRQNFYNKYFGTVVTKEMVGKKLE